MNNDLVIEVSKELNLKTDNVFKTLELLKEGATVPFIARYRKEATGGLDEEEIREISLRYEYVVNLKQKKEDVQRLIDEKGLLTADLVKKINNAKKLVELDDIYRPFKEKRKTKATDAINNGLEPLAKTIMTFPIDIDIDNVASSYINKKVLTIKDALEGAGFIIAEWISDDAVYRKFIREYLFKNAKIVTKVKKTNPDIKKIYEMYYEYSEQIKFIKPHRVLAINRAEKEKVLTVSLDFLEEDIINYMESKIIKNDSSPVSFLVKDSIKDSLKRLIYPSVEREIRSELKALAEEQAIKNFSENLKNLIMTQPVKEKIVLGFDPAFRTGCKLAVLDKFGDVLKIEVIYPHEPQKEIEKSENILIKLIDEYNIDIIAIGNGTASRESEVFVANVIKKIDKNVEYIIVNEAGASVYSASKLAIEEFPDLQVEQRSAVSIGRRLQDPLAELVKIDPMSIGVGLYQHDVTPKLLKESLDFTVLSSVNNVGVDVNTASVSLLNYVSGLTKSVSEKIITYRQKLGKIMNKEQLKKVLSPKAYEQSVGFLRISDGENKLDETSIHPESYEIALKILKDNDLKLTDLGTEKIKTIDFSNNYNIDNYTFKDIIESFKKPIRDPRDEYEKPLLKSEVVNIEDLTVGMELEGTVRNVVDFGAFIDIGLGNDGLVHISKISKNYVKHPSDVLAVGDIVKCYVIDIDKDKERVSLSLFKD